MKPSATDKKVVSSVSGLACIIRKGLFVYILSGAGVSALCFISGWRSLANIGTGFTYGALVMGLFGTLTFAGNTVPAQLSKLSLPKYKAPSGERQQEAKRDEPTAKDQAIGLFLITLTSAALLFMTGVFLKSLP